MSYDQTAVDLTKYRTVDPAATYRTKQDDKIKRREEIAKQLLSKRWLDKKKAALNRAAFSNFI